MRVVSLRGCSEYFDLEAVRRLYEVRVDDLTLSRENLSQPANQVGLGR